MTRRDNYVILDCRGIKPMYIKISKNFEGEVASMKGWTHKLSQFLGNLEGKPEWIFLYLLPSLQRYILESFMTFQEEKGGYDASFIKRVAHELNRTESWVQTQRTLAAASLGFDLEIDSRLRAQAQERRREMEETLGALKKLFSDDDDMAKDLSRLQEENIGLNQKLAGKDAEAETLLNEAAEKEEQVNRIRRFLEALKSQASSMPSLLGRIVDFIEALLEDPDRALAIFGGLQEEVRTLSVAASSAQKKPDPAEAIRAKLEFHRVKQDSVEEEIKSLKFALTDYSRQLKAYVEAKKNQEKELVDLRDANRRQRGELQATACEARPEVLAALTSQIEETDKKIGLAEGVLKMYEQNQADLEEKSRLIEEKLKVQEALLKAVVERKAALELTIKILNEGNGRPVPSAASHPEQDVKQPDITSLLAKLDHLTLYRLLGRFVEVTRQRAITEAGISNSQLISAASKGETKLLEFLRPANFRAVGGIMRALRAKGLLDKNGQIDAGGLKIFIATGSKRKSRKH